MRSRQTESAKKAEMRKQNNRDSKMRKQDKVNYVQQSIKKARKLLQRTQDPENHHRHRKIMCIICDRFIIGIEGICILTKDQIPQHNKSLSVESYENYYETMLNPEVKRQCQVNVEGIKDLLLLLNQESITMGMPLVHVDTMECSQ